MWSHFLPGEVALVMSREPDSKRRSWNVTRHVTLASIVMSLAIWLASGTLAPYGATLDRPLVLEPCHYLANVDHDQFFAGYALLDRQPPSRWSNSVVLRRILYPLLAYPLMKLFTVVGNETTGFLVGGLLTTILISVAALIVFCGFLRRRYGDSAAAIAAWIVATYPGVTYWGGLPYAYAAIVPLSLMGLVLLFKIDESEDTNAHLKWSLLLGVVFTGYDLLPFFGAASFFLVARRRSVRWSVTNAAAFVLPSAAVGAFLLFLPHLSSNNSNTSVYTTVVRAYLEPNFNGWGGLLAKLPEVALSNLLFGNFLFLPLAALIAVFFGREKLERAEWALAAGVFAVFLFNNAAPPYGGWQVRGEWIGRFYQPVFVVYVSVLARWGVRGRWRTAGVVLLLLLNSSTVFGPLFGSRVSSWLYARFYHHSADDAMSRNLEHYGRRPLGLCDESRGLDDPHRDEKLPDRPRYMYVPWTAPR